MSPWKGRIVRRCYNACLWNKSYKALTYIKEAIESVLNSVFRLHLCLIEIHCINQS